MEAIAPWLTAKQVYGWEATDVCEEIGAVLVQEVVEPYEKKRADRIGYVLMQSEPMLYMLARIYTQLSRIEPSGYWAYRQQYIGMLAQGLDNALYRLHVIAAYHFEKLTFHGITEEWVERAKYALKDGSARYLFGPLDLFDPNGGMSTLFAQRQIKMAHRVRASIRAACKHFVMGWIRHGVTGHTLVPTTLTGPIHSYPSLDPVVAQVVIYGLLAPLKNVRSSRYVSRARYAFLKMHYSAPGVAGKSRYGQVTVLWAAPFPNLITWWEVPLKPVAK